MFLIRCTSALFPLCFQFYFQPHVLAPVFLRGDWITQLSENGREIVQPFHHGYPVFVSLSEFERPLKIRNSGWIIASTNKDIADVAERDLVVAKCPNFEKYRLRQPKQFKRFFVFVEVEITPAQFTMHCCRKKAGAVVHPTRTGHA